MSGTIVGMPDPTPTPSNFAHDPTWRVFRIMAEFIEGFTMLGGLPKSVTVFGSARVAEDNGDPIGFYPGIVIKKQQKISIC